jgi:hypothetical protein
MSDPHGLPFIESEASRHGVVRTTEFDLNSIDSWGRILGAYDAPSQTTHSERLFTYGLIMAKRPERVLEIGFRFGGNSFLMLCALEDVGHGKLVAIDPEPAPVLDFSRFGDRFTLIRGRSPEDVPRAIDALGGTVDFCFVDGDHTAPSVRADLEAIIPHMAKESYVLLHDATRPSVHRATQAFLSTRSGRVIDCGLVCPWASDDKWSGLRLLRVVQPDDPSGGTAAARRRKHWWQWPWFPFGGRHSGRGTVDAQ